MLLHIKNYAFLISTLLVFSACGGSKPDEQLEEVSDEAPKTTLDSQKISAQNVFNALPGRNEIINLTTKAQAEYNAAVLNDPNNVKNYSIESSKALNLGVYGSDLNVTGVFEQTQ